MVSKVAEKDPARAMQFLRELKDVGIGWGISGYVATVGKNGNWQRAIDDLRRSNIPALTGDSENSLSRAAQSAIVTAWIHEDFDQALHWVTQDIGRDYSKAEDAVDIALQLSRVPIKKRTQVVDWIESQVGTEQWDEQLVMRYGNQVAGWTPDTHTDRLLKLLKNEENRVQFITEYISHSPDNPKLRLRHQRYPLNRLIEKAELSEANATRLRNLVASGTAP